MIVGAGELAFHRSTKPEDGTASPQLVVFWDRRDPAFSCTIYTRWPLGSGGYRLRLLAAKAKVAPKYATSTTRMELNGAHLSRQATLVVVKALPQPPERVWVAGDSETILACREKTGGFFT